MVFDFTYTKCHQNIETVTFKHRIKGRLTNSFQQIKFQYL